MMIKELSYSAYVLPVRDGKVALLKYGENGYLKLWIPWSDNADRLSGLRRLLADPDNARAAVTDAYFRLTLRPCSDSL